MASDSDPRGALLGILEGRRDIDGRFEQITRIGRLGGGGHWSLLVSAWDRHSKKRVALKFYDPLRRQDAYRWSCFQREAELLPRFAGQPDILQCVAPLSQFEEFVRHESSHVEFPITFAYYGVELAESDVNEAIVGDWWSAADKFFYFRAMCRAVQRVHTNGVAHRDLKPDNFLIMSDRTLRLSDFGTARCIGEREGAILEDYALPPGHQAYAAPEIWASLHDVHPAIAFRADIYALGAILFELFSGTQLNVLVFDRETTAALNQAMNAVDRSARMRTYESFVRDMADAHPLPSLGLFGGAVPLCILQLVDRLYMSLAAIDYRHRPSDFNSIFQDVNRCSLILEHVAAYQRWRLRRARMTRKPADTNKVTSASAEAAHKGE